MARVALADSRPVPRINVLLGHGDDALDASRGRVLPGKEILFKVSQSAPVCDPRVYVDLTSFDQLDHTRKVRSEGIARAKEGHLAGVKEGVVERDFVFGVPCRKTEQG